MAGLGSCGDTHRNDPVIARACPRRVLRAPQQVAKTVPGTGLPNLATLARSAARAVDDAPLKHVGREATPGCNISALNLSSRSGTGQISVPSVSEACHHEPPRTVAALRARNVTAHRRHTSRAPRWHAQPHEAQPATGRDGADRRRKPPWRSTNTLRSHRQQLVDRPRCRSAVLYRVGYCDDPTRHAA